MKALTYVEIDQPRCALTYGVAPCSAPPVGLSSIPTLGFRWNANEWQTTFFQDAARTVPAVVGGPVGGIFDAACGNHLSQTDATARPILRYDSDRTRYYLEFDGVNDHLVNTSAKLTAADIGIYFVAQDSGSSGYAGVLSARGTNEDWNSANGFSLERSDSSVFALAHDFFSNGVVSWGAQTFAVYEFHRASGGFSAVRDGSGVASGTHSTPSSETLGGFAIGMRWVDGPAAALSAPFTGRIYSMEVAGRALTNEEKTARAAYHSAQYPMTGGQKCYNSRKTCKSIEDYDETLETLRFSIDTDYLPRQIDAIASIVDWSVSPAIISLGEDLGLRAELRVTLKDHPWPDVGALGDKYVAERDYEPFSQGTFWGKWRARFQYLRGRSIRLINGRLGQALEGMETRHFVVETVDGPNVNGTVTIVAKDPLKLLDGDRAQAPKPNNGFLVADITAGAGSFTLAPTGVGAEYPASGFLNIGGSEIVAFTRSGDTVTMTGRGQLGTVAAAHQAQDRAQLVLRYAGDDPADIIYDLMVNYADVPPEYINLEDWKAETTSFLRRVFSATIGDPVDVKRLIVEMIQQGALSIWWDDVSQTIRLRVLRAIDTDAEIIDASVVQQGTFRTAEQPNKRISQVWLYYGQRNPLRNLEDTDNFRSLAVTVNTDAEVNYGAPAIRKIFSRWIAAGGRTVAVRVGEIILGRYKDPPRRFDFTLLRGVRSLIAGQGYRAGWWTLQDVTGAPETVPIQLTRLNPGAAEIKCEAEEQFFQIIDPEDLTNRTIIFDAAIQDVNLRSVHDSLYPAPATDDTFTLTCFIETNVIVGASAATVTAFDVGSWPAGVTINIVNNGRIQGAGGRGGNVLAGNGQAGGLAFYTRKTVTINNLNGRIYGGGGGGAAGSIKSAGKLAGGGGGGAGAVPGTGGRGSISPDFDGQPGTLNSGGNGGPSTSSAWPGGRGGDIGGAGQNAGGGGIGGAAGRAVDGNSFVTFTNEGDIRGARIN